MKQLLFALIVCLALPVSLRAESTSTGPEKKHAEVPPPASKKQCVECVETILHRVSNYQASLSTYGVTFVEMKDRTHRYPTLVRGGISGPSHPAGGVEVLFRW